MAPLKHAFLKSTNLFIFFLIPVLVFTTSCEDEPPDYGPAYFIVNGDIKSTETNQPIPDIIVELRRVVNSEDGQSNSSLVATDFSDTTGSYGLSEMFAFSENHTYQIKFTDTDGALNGEYETLDTTVVFGDPKFTYVNGSWKLDTVEKELNVQLKPKE